MFPDELLDLIEQGDLQGVLDYVDGNILNPDISFKEFVALRQYFVREEVIQILYSMKFEDEDQEQAARDINVGIYMNIIDVIDAGVPIIQRRVQEISEIITDIADDNLDDLFADEGLDLTWKVLQAAGLVAVGRLSLMNVTEDPEDKRSVQIIKYIVMLASNIQLNTPQDSFARDMNYKFLKINKENLGLASNVSIEPYSVVIYVANQYSEYIRGQA
jgi:hypothetical protein